jgi:PAS domain-containing protein
MQPSLKHPDELFQENERLKALLHSQKESKSLGWADSSKAVPCAHEEAYRLFVEKAPDGIVVVNEQGLYIEANYHYTNAGDERDRSHKANKDIQTS